MGQAAFLTKSLADTKKTRLPREAGFLYRACNAVEKCRRYSRAFLGGAPGSGWLILPSPLCKSENHTQNLQYLILAKGRQDAQIPVFHGFSRNNVQVFFLDASLAEVCGHFDD